MQFNESYFEVEPGIKIYVRDYFTNDPKAPAVLCLHGLTRNGQDFTAMIEQLRQTATAAGPRFIVPDLRGRGLSQYDPDPSHYYPAHYVADMWELLDDMHVSNFHIIGTSMGGIMAILMHHAKPRQVDGVLLNDIGPMVPLPGLAHILTYLGLDMEEDSWDAVLAAMKNRHHQDLPDFTESEWDAIAKRTYAQNEDGTWVQAYDPLIRGPVEEAYAEGMELDLWEAYSVINKPLLLLRGELSQLLPKALAEQMLSKNPDCKVVEIPRKGHVPQLDEPESIQAILDWLALAPQ